MIKITSQLKTLLNSKIVLPALLLILILFHGCEKFRPNSRVGEEFGPAFERIKNLGLSQEKAYEYLRVITSVGSRLTGSPGAEKAVQLTVSLLEEAGADRVWTEPVRVRRWVRGRPETVLVRSQKKGEQNLRACALGNSPGTPGKGIEARVVEVNSFEELARLKNLVKDRIVFFNVPMDRTITDPFSAYGRAAQFRVRGATEAARYGALAVLVRSMTFRIDTHPHTGLILYEDGVPKIPAAAISTADAENLHAWLQEDPELTVFIRMDCGFLEDTISANVMGELRGTSRPEEVILVGGHLDSWDLSPGAHDDAAGCAVAIEVIRLIKDSGLKPERTIRAVLFMDEEFGGSGGRAYVQNENRKQETHLIAFEQDRGGFVPIGLAIGGGEKMSKKIRPIQKYLQPLGVNWIRPGGGGVDVAPLAEQGVITGSVIPDSQRYFDLHHSALDVLESVHPRELELQAVILAMITYYLAQKGV